MKTATLVVLAAVTGYSFAGAPESQLGSAFEELKNLTLIGIAEREMRCRSQTGENEVSCRAAFGTLIDRAFDAESKVIEALTAEQAGDIARRDALIQEMRKAAADGREELERLKSLHVP